MGLKLLEERKAHISQEKLDAKGPRDLLTALIRANMNPNVPESQRLSDEDVIGRKCLQILKCQ